MKPCRACGETKPLADFHQNRAAKDGRQSRCRACARFYAKAHFEGDRDRQLKLKRDRKNRMRDACVELLGGACLRCGFSDPRALQIDHVHGGGNREQKMIGNDGIRQRVLAGEPGYKLLCANCNWIKRSENNEIGVR